MADTFKSARLTYRAFDWDTDQEYLQQRQADVEGLANSSSAMLKAHGKDDIEGLKRKFESCLLAVVICLPPATEGGKAVAVGDVTLAALEPRTAHHRSTNIGIRLLPPYQGKGYGSEAILWVTNWAFRMAGVHRVGMLWGLDLRESSRSMRLTIRIGIGGFSWNKRATDLYERLGFVPEARRRECVWFDGGWHDVVELAMLDREWEAIKKKA